MIFQFEPGHWMHWDALRAGITTLMGEHHRSRALGRNHPDFLYWGKGNVFDVVVLEHYDNGLSRIDLDENLAPQLIEVFEAWVKMTDDTSCPF